MALSSSLEAIQPQAFLPSLCYATSRSEWHACAGKQSGRSQRHHALWWMACLRLSYWKMAGAVSGAASICRFHTQVPLCSIPAFSRALPAGPDESRHLAGSEGHTVFQDEGHPFPWSAAANPTPALSVCLLNHVDLQWHHEHGDNNLNVMGNASHEQLVTGSVLQVTESVATLDKTPLCRRGWDRA